MTAPATSADLTATHAYRRAFRSALTKPNVAWADDEILSVAELEGAIAAYQADPARGLPGVPSLADVARAEAQATQLDNADHVCALLSAVQKNLARGVAKVLELRDVDSNMCDVKLEGWAWNVPLSDALREAGYPITATYGVSVVLHDVDPDDEKVWWSPLYMHPEDVLIGHCISEYRRPAGGSMFDTAYDIERLVVYIGYDEDDDDDDSAEPDDDADSYSDLRALADTCKRALSDSEAPRKRRA